MTDVDPTAPTELDDSPSAGPLGRFIVLGPLGSGGMGTVLRAYDEKLDRKIAIKVLHAGTSERHTKRLLREAQALAKLSHPNVVQVYEVGCLSIDETGDVTKIDAFNVSDSFDDGDSKTYNPPRELAGFNIREGGAEFLVNAAKKLKEYILGLLDGAVGVVLGELASIVASLVAQAIGAVIRWLRELWQDDVFPAISDEVAMHSLDQHFATGTRTSSIRTRSTSAHGGKYRIRFDWRLTT